MDWRILYIVFTLNLATISSALAYFSWKRREKPAARTFAGLMATVVAISLPYAAELSSDTLRALVFWSKIEYFGLTALPVVWLAFVFDYTGNQRWLKPRNFLQLAIIPAFTLFLVLTNESHDLIWAKERVDSSGTFPTFAPTYGFMFWVYLSYTYLLLAYGSLTLIRKALNTWSLYRRQTIAILLGTFLAWFGQFLVISGLNPIPQLNPLPIFFNLGCLCLAWAVFRLSMLDFVPVSYEDVLESLPDGVLTVDVNNRVTAFNSVIRGFLVRRPEDAIAMPVAQVFPEIPPQHHHLYHDKEAHTIVETDNHRNIEVRISPIYNRRKQFMGRLLLFRDVTRRKRAESALTQRVEQLNLLREVYEEIGSTFNLDKILKLAIDAAMRLSKSDAGYIALVEQDEIEIAASAGYGDSSHKIMLRTDVGIVKRIISRRKPEMILDVFKDVDYSPFLLDTKAKMVFPLVAQDSLIGVINLETTHSEHYGQEIFDFLQILASRIAAAIENAKLHHSLQTQLGEVHQLYQKVSSLEQLKTDMIRMAAHDIRNPLAVIANALEMLEDENVRPEVREIYFKPMLNASERITRISQDILSLERIEAMALGVNMQKVNLCEHANRAVKDYFDYASQKSQLLRSQIENDHYEVQGDAMQLYEAMANLIGNAIKYTPIGGEITINLTSDNSDIIFTVQDTGYGIPHDRQGRIFQPFFRVKTHETQDIDGTGLGLHLVKNIIERHNGHIIFNSTYGKGSTFGFRLPRCLEPD